MYLHPLQYSRVRRCQVGPCQGPSWLSCLVGATRGSVKVGWGRSVYGCVWKLWHPYIQKWIAIRIELPSELKPAIPIENQATPIRILPLGLGPMGSPGLNGSHFAINVDGGGRYLFFLGIRWNLIRWIRCKESDLNHDLWNQQTVLCKSHPEAVVWKLPLLHGLLTVFGWTKAHFINDGLLTLGVAFM